MFSTKRKQDTTMRCKMVLWYILYLLLSIVGLFLFKAYSSSISIIMDKGKISLQLSPLVLLGLVFYVCSFILWLFFIKRNNISFIYGVLAGSVTVCTVVGGYFLFNEKLTLMQIVGIILIVAGLIIVNLFKL